MQETKTSEVLSMDRALSVNFLRANGIMAVKCHKKAKGPDKYGSWADYTKDTAAQVLSDIEFTDDNLAALFCEDVVDVDVDTENPIIYEALTAFLPKCSHTWGRGNKLMSHRAYKLTDAYKPEEHRVMLAISRLPDLAIELRGGSKASGNYTLLPGSVHPSGDLYKWHNAGDARATATVTTAKRLTNAIRQAVAVASLVGVWYEGVRQEATMALAGFLHRIHKDALENGDAGEDQFFLDMEGGLAFLRVLLDCADDDMSDRKDRIAAFKKTWKKAEDGINVTGATRISELAGDPKLLDLMYVLFSDVSDMKLVHEFQTNFGILKNTGLVVAIGKTGNKTSMFNRTGFSNGHEHIKVRMGDKFRPIVDVLYGSKSTTRFDEVTFDPSEGAIIDKGNRLLLNQWEGFAVEPWPSPVKDNEVQWFIDYVWEVIVQGQQDRFDWVMNWVADIFKDPKTRKGTCLVLVGPQGAGKSFLGEMIIAGIVGDNHSAQFNDVTIMTGKHNTAIASALFVQCDEATNSNQRGTAQKLKSLITDPRIRIEPKGIDSYALPNRARFLFTSNELATAMNIGDGAADRRNYVLEVSTAKVGLEETYWDMMGKKVEDKENLAKVHKWLLQREYNPSSLRRAPLTMEKMRMAETSMGTFASWLQHIVNTGHPIEEHVHVRMMHATPLDQTHFEVDRQDWPMAVDRAAIIASYEAYTRKRGSHNNDVGAERVMDRLIELGLVSNVSKEKRVSLTDSRTDTTTRVRVKYHDIAGHDKFKEYVTNELKLSVQEFVVETETQNAPIKDDF